MRSCGGPAGGGGSSSGAGGSATPYYAEDFEGGTPGFSLAVGGGQAWIVGTPTYGPGAAHGGTRCAAVTLGREYQASSYATCATAPFSLAGARNSVPVIWHAYETEKNVDGGRVYIETSAGLEVIEPFRGYSRPAVRVTSDVAFTGCSGGASRPPVPWVEDRFDLTRYAGQTSVRVHFEFVSNASTTAGGPFSGWFLDDIVVGEPAAVGHASAPFDPTPLFREIEISAAYRRDYAFSGTMAGWRRCSVDLTPALAAVGRNLYIGFAFASDGSNPRTYHGWFVDDVAVYAR